MRNITTFEQLSHVLNGFISLPDTTQKYTLDRMIQLMNILGNPQDNLKVIHVAGTSGKTSTSYYVASLLQAAGYRTGLTVSPHIDEVNERAQIDMTPLSEAQFCSEFSIFMDIIDKSSLRPTYFELLVAFSFWLFNKYDVDYAVIEVGIGGLLDSTNVTSRPDKVCVITDIGLDHTEILGDTVGEIAVQKAGIIKSNNAVFIRDQPSSIVNVVGKQCVLANAQLHVINDDAHISSLPLFQQRNFSLAQAVVDYILVRDGGVRLSDRKINAAANIAIPARMEVVKFHSKLIVLDGSHNEQKIEALVSSMRDEFPDKQIHLMISFGFVATRRSNILASMKLLSQLGSAVVITDYSYNNTSLEPDRRAQQLAEIAQQAGFKSITIQPNPILAFRAFAEAINSVGLITGSFYLLRRVRNIALNDS